MNLNKRGFIGLKRFIILISVCLLFHTCGYAGLLPDSKTAFGTFMPSAEKAIGRKADQVVNSDQGQSYIWNHFDAEDYQSFNLYLVMKSCVGICLRAEDGVLELEIKDSGNEDNAKSIFMTYNAVEENMCLLYPKGTRPEDSDGMVAQFSEGEQNNRNALPSLHHIIGIKMPNPQVLPGWELSEMEENEKGEIIHTYLDVKEEEYEEFSRLAASCDCELRDWQKHGSEVMIEIYKEYATMEMEYDSLLRKAELIYSPLADPELLSSDEEKGSLFPSFKSLFGVVLPAAEFAIHRSPTSEKRGEGGITQVYHYFTDEEYEQLSVYLKSAGCTVLGYKNEGDIITINLEKEGEEFSFVYNRYEKKAEINYMSGSVIEQVTPTPTPEPTPVPTDTPEPRGKSHYEYYSEQECYNAALDYLKKRLKNPASLQVHSYTSKHETGKYIFVIDYSAQNSFGGYNRDNYYVTVSSYTGEVLSGF